MSRRVTLPCLAILLGAGTASGSVTNRPAAAGPPARPARRVYDGFIQWHDPSVIGPSRPDSPDTPSRPDPSAERPRSDRLAPSAPSPQPPPSRPSARRAGTEDEESDPLWILAPAEVILGATNQSPHISAGWGWLAEDAAARGAEEQSREQERRDHREDPAEFDPESLFESVTDPLGRFSVFSDTPGRPEAGPASRVQTPPPAGLIFPSAFQEPPPDERFPGLRTEPGRETLDASRRAPDPDSVPREAGPRVDPPVRPGFLPPQDARTGPVAITPHVPARPPAREPVASIPSRPSPTGPLPAGSAPGPREDIGAYGRVGAVFSPEASPGIAVPGRLPAEPNPFSGAYQPTRPFRPDDLPRPSGRFGDPMQPPGRETERRSPLAAPPQTNPFLPGRLME